MSLHAVRGWLVFFLSEYEEHGASKRVKAEVLTFTHTQFLEEYTHTYTHTHAPAELLNATPLSLLLSGWTCFPLGAERVLLF